jgi:hypothetical protein
MRDAIDASYVPNKVSVLPKRRGGRGGGGMSPDYAWWAHGLPRFVTGLEAAGRGKGCRGGAGMVEGEREEEEEEEEEDVMWVAAFRNAQWPFAPVVIRKGGGRENMVGVTSVTEVTERTTTVEVEDDEGNASAPPSPLLYSTGI